ncbi:RagB/SusD family nutrient uptake outer membrane protein [Niabella beijingensis]|uniref:RagB/SusD family nutrient uptake outer membrane protein n=1 Tax=Niabella beijingensis TaxID=2872700 RepID=UPI001CC08462|nr:RagB/SusD family nutrient uptake outer membrane protein [Niabella beijingensis]MBZ4189506.1 RagB/SusD family nutrient uptake outer membrane protein [Niabella beijingensis]
MKNYRYTLGVSVAVAFIFSSCKKDFLTLYPEGNLNEKIFYKTPADFQQAIVGAYIPLRDIANNAFWMDEERSDNAHYDYYEKDRGNAQRESLADFMDDAENGVTVVRYQAAYVGIGRVNAVLDHIETNTTIADSLKKLIIGEAKALRGHYYFDLVRNFGGVPLHLHEVLKAEDAYLPRATADQIYTQVISDLKDALGLLPAPAFKPEETGRVNKGVVATELAAVYMQRKNFEEAATLLKTVTQMGYALMTDFSGIFNPANKNANVNKELIFDVQYQSATPGQQSSFIYRFTPITPSTKVILGVDFNNGLGGWDVPTDDLKNVFEAGDKRFDASIGVIEGSLNSSQDFVPSKVVSAVGYTPPAGVVVRWFCKKFYFPPYPNINQYSDQNWPLYRYGDVLLMLAECLNETGKAGEALPYLNQIRGRAFGDASHNITTTDPVLLRAAIAKERRRELAFENKRWQDLIRTGEAITVMTAYGVKAKQKYPYLLPQSYTVTQDRLLYPIPQREMDLNKSLVQNPGYTK